MAKICDLGIAKATVKEKDIFTGLKTNVGTYPYKAPELFNITNSDDSVDHDISVDIFSLGMFISAFIDGEDYKELPDPACKYKDNLCYYSCGYSYKLLTINFSIRCNTPPLSIILIHRSCRII